VLRTGLPYVGKRVVSDHIASTGLKLEEGLIVHFYRPDTNGKNNEDYLFFEGTVHFDSDKKQWYAVIDEKTYRHESDVHSLTR